MIIGAHVSAAGGIGNAIDRAVEIGAEAVQIFGSSTRSWRFKALTDADAEGFRAKSAAAGLAPPFLHAIYLINLGNPKPDNIEKSVTSLVNYMNLAEQIGAGGVIFHPGSHGGAGYDGIFQQVVDSINRVLETDRRGAAAVPGEHGRYGSAHRRQVQRAGRRAPGPWTAPAWAFAWTRSTPSPPVMTSPTRRAWPA